MLWQTTPYVIPSLVATAASLAMVPYAWRRRPTPGAGPFVALCLATAWWSLGQTLGVSVADLPSKVMFAKLQWLGIAAAPLAWLAFALAFGGREAWLTPRRAALLALLPSITLGLVFTNEGHGLIWDRVSLAEGAPFAALKLSHGPWFALQFAYNYVLILVSTLLTMAALSQSPHYRRQSAAVAAAPVIVAAANLLHLSKWNPSPFLDLTPLGFALASAALGSALLRYRLFDLVPVARGRIVEGMSEGVLVVDQPGRVVDLNPAAEAMLGQPASRILGVPLSETASWVAALGENRAGGPAEVSPELAGSPRAYEVTFTPLHGSSGSLAGKLFVLRDTTERRRADEMLRNARAELRVANEELQRLADTDPLTGLASRRHFFERLGEEVRRARRHKQQLAAVMIDLDLFKRVNDTHGHVAGDRVLATVASIIGDVKRESDVAGRLGREEFALILPSTESEGARLLAERLRERLGSERYAVEAGEAFSVTASLGVAALSDAVKDGDALLGLADAALYRAKGLGRDRTCVAEPPTST